MANGILVEPSAAARAAAKGIHEWFVALTREGFTEAQALQIIGVGLAAQIHSMGDGRG